MVSFIARNTSPLSNSNGQLTKNLKADEEKKVKLS